MKLTPPCIWHGEGESIFGPLGKLLLPHLKPIANRGMSNAYALVLGLVGLGLCGFTYTVFDQVVMGDVWNFAVQQQLNGTILQIFSTIWQFVPVLLTITFILSMLVNSHFERQNP